MTTTPPPGVPGTPGMFRIDPGLGEAVTREDYHPQANLKFQPHNNFD